MGIQEKNITIEKLVYGGAGLGRIDGQVVLTPYVLPGERVRIDEGEKRGGVLRAGLLDVEQKSAARVDPPCPYFGRCGGCHYQHASYEYQLAQKVEILREVLRRIGKMEPPEEIAIVSGPEWGYRNRAQLHFERGRVGYLEAGSHRLCPIKSCPISSPKLNQAIAALGEMAADRRWPAFVRSIELFTNELETQVNVLESGQHVARRFFEWCEERIPGSLAPSLDYAAAGHVFRVGPRSFFQVNRHLCEQLVETAVGDSSGARALDLYAGVGLFSLALAARFDEVIAIESGRGAVEDLRFNAERAGRKVTAVETDCEKFLPEYSGATDLVLADPPRAGMGKRVLAELARLRPKTLVIVACDPATLARDLAVLAGHGFVVDSITMVDLFPQTFHFETVVRLTCQSRTDTDAHT